MANNNQNVDVINLEQLVKEKSGLINYFITNLAVKITNWVDSMRKAFLAWIVTTSLITLIARISQNFLQHVFSFVIMVGQNVIQEGQFAIVDSEHKTLAYLANLKKKPNQRLDEHDQILNKTKSINMAFKFITLEY
jgi:hypothetical protein